jgi:hypothetical protein
VKYSPQGKRLWARNPVLPAGTTVEVTSFVVDGSGNSYIVGGGEPDFGGSPWLVAKVSSRGKVCWTATEARPGWWGSPNDVAVRNGTVYVTGGMAPQVPDETAIEACTTIAYSPSGKRLWASDFATPDAWQSFGEEVVATAKGVTVLGGHYTGENDLPKGIFVLRYSTSGAATWQADWPSPNGGPVWGMGLTATRDGGAAIGVMYAAPGIDAPGESDTAVIVKFLASGGLAWSTPLAPGTSDQFWTVTERADKTIVGVGVSDPFNAAAMVVAPSGQSLFVGRYGMSGRVFDPRSFAVRGRSMYVAGASWTDSSPDRAALVVLPVK